MKRANFESRRNLRRAVAKANADARAKLSDAQQLAKLHAAGHRALKERKRLKV